MKKTSLQFIIILALTFVTMICYSQVSLSAKGCKRITNVIDSYPMPSPDGSKIVFQSNRTGDWEIYTINEDGSNLQQLTHSKGFDGGPVWSPDGEKIVFPSDRDNDPEIYIMDADGSNQKRLTKTLGDDSHPHWFPDGTKIIFNSARTSADLNANWGKQWHEIFSMNTDGSDVKQITSFKTVSTYPSVSPDGKNIAFRRVIDGPAFNWDLSTNVNNRDSKIFVTDIHGMNPVNVSRSPAFDGWPCWAPDSTTIMFVSNRSGPANTGQIYVVDKSGAGLKKLLDFPGSLAQPTWSKDGKKVFAYENIEVDGSEFGNIVVIDVASGE